MQFEGISIAHLGSISEIPSEDIINELSEVNVLFLPVGGNGVLSASKASKLVNQIDPKIVIPIYHKVPGLTIELDTVSKFIKETGLSAQEEDKLILKKKDLTDEMQLIVLKS